MSSYHLEVIEKDYCSDDDAAYPEYVICFHKDAKV